MKVLWKLLDSCWIFLFWERWQWYLISKLSIPLLNWSVAWFYLKNNALQLCAHHFSAYQLFQGNTITFFTLGCFAVAANHWILCFPASTIHSVLRLLLMGALMTLHNAWKMVKQGQYFPITCFFLKLLLSSPPTHLGKSFSQILYLSWCSWSIYHARIKIIEVCFLVKRVALLHKLGSLSSGPIYSNVLECHASEGVCK